MPTGQFYYVAAAGYSCGAYGAGGFGDECDTTSTGQSGGSTPIGGNTGSGTGTGTQSGAGGIGGILADTGYNVLLPVAFALAILFASLVLLAKRLRRRTTERAE